MSAQAFVQTCAEACMPCAQPSSTFPWCLQNMPWGFPESCWHSRCKNVPKTACPEQNQSPNWNCPPISRRSALYWCKRSATSKSATAFSKIEPLATSRRVSQCLGTLPCSARLASLRLAGDFRVLDPGFGDSGFGVQGFNETNTE